MSTFNETDHPRHGDGKWASKELGETDPGFGEEAGPSVGLDFHVGEPVGGWGDVSNIEEGSRTPWGRADNVTYPADGIAVVGTPSHGGIKLSPERNSEIPKALRNSSGWYEEDCEALVVGMFYPEALPHVDPAHARSRCEEGVKDWLPDQYEEAFGTEVPLEESYVKRQRAEEADSEKFRAANSYRFVTTRNWSRGDGWAPSGYLVMEARIDDTGEVRHWLVPKSEASPTGMVRRDIVIDPDKHLDVTDVVNTSPPGPMPGRRVDGPRLTGDQIKIRTDHLSSSQANRALAELDKQYRFIDDDGSGTVETMAEHFRRVGLVGKSAVAYGNKPGTTYNVEYGNGRVHNVSKATFDALRSVPNTTSELDYASIERRAAETYLERAQRDLDFDKIAKGKERVEAARAKHAEISEREDQKRREWSAERDRLQREAFQEIAEARGLAFD